MAGVILKSGKCIARWRFRARCQSASLSSIALATEEGLAQSKTWRDSPRPPQARSVLDCGALYRFSPASSLAKLLHENSAARH